MERTLDPKGEEQREQVHQAQEWVDQLTSKKYLASPCTEPSSLPTGRGCVPEMFPKYKDCMSEMFTVASKAQPQGKWGFGEIN